MNELILEIRTRFLVTKGVYSGAASKVLIVDGSVWLWLLTFWYALVVAVCTCANGIGRYHMR